MYEKLLHDINSMCILKLAYQQDIYRQSEGRSRSHLYLLPGKVNYTQAKGYCAISLLSFMQKTMEKLVTKISTTKYWGMSPTFIIICYKTGKSTETTMHHVDTHIQGAAENRSYTWAYLDIEAAWDSNACDTTKAAHGMGLENTF